MIYNCIIHYGIYTLSKIFYRYIDFNSNANVKLHGVFFLQDEDYGVYKWEI